MSRYRWYQDLNTKIRRTKMTKTLAKVFLAIALFCGTTMADGNMGDGGYTGCDGSNPPPTCECNVPNPPATCSTGGFAVTNAYESQDAVLTSVVIELIDT